MKEISDIIVEHGLNERLDQIAMKDAEYLKRDREYSDLLKQCESTGMTREQLRLVDNITAAYADAAARYAELAYEMGMRDGTSLLCGLKTGSV